jgi:hypothetical protein
MQNSTLKRTRTPEFEIKLSAKGQNRVNNSLKTKENLFLQLIYAYLIQVLSHLVILGIFSPLSQVFPLLLSSIF